MSLEQTQIHAHTTASLVKSRHIMPGAYTSAPCHTTRMQCLTSVTIDQLPGLCACLLGFGASGGGGLVLPKGMGFSLDVAGSSSDGLVTENKSHVDIEHSIHLLFAGIISIGS